uniref:Vacuolar segregation protein pep7 n=4 Tax=Lygus hesperus TaxID=30085 RepID=A0A0A9WG91_LYGHE
MENQNLNANKRYNKFRQARRKKDKSNTINVDEVSGRHYKLERFLRDCILHLPKHIQESENELSDANNNANPTTSKTRRTKHVKLPVLNECKGLFENVIIGRSAKKVGEFGDIAVTPEDRARLHEDIHALAKVGPDSELSFEILPPSPLRNRPSDEIEDPQEMRATPVSPPEQVTDTPSLNAPPGGSWPEEHTQTRRSRSPREAEHEEARSHEEVIRESRPNSAANDCGLKEGGRQSPQEDVPRKSPSFHCDCCRRSEPAGNFFDADAILNSNSASEPEPAASPRAASPGIASELIFGDRGDRNWLFEDAPGGPANSPGVTYGRVGAPPFDFGGIEIQSAAPDSWLGGFGGEGVDVYAPRCRRETPAALGMLKRRIPRCSGLNGVRDVKRYASEDTSNLQSDSICLPHLSPYNKFRFNRSLSPRKY